MATDKKRSHAAPERAPARAPEQTATAPATTSGVAETTAEQAQARAAADSAAAPRRNPRAAATPVFVAPRKREPREGQSEATLHVTPRQRNAGASPVASPDSTPAAED